MWESILEISKIKISIQYALYVDTGNHKDFFPVCPQMALCRPFQLHTIDSGDEQWKWIQLTLAVIKWHFPFPMNDKTTFCCCHQRTLLFCCRPSSFGCTNRTIWNKMIGRRMDSNLLSGWGRNSDQSIFYATIPFLKIKWIFIVKRGFSVLTDWPTLQEQ